MIIKPLKELYVETGNIISANKLRISNIKRNTKDIEYIENKFMELTDSLKENKINNTLKIVKESLFFEEIPVSIVKSIQDKYNTCRNKDEFVNNLKESYYIRGFKGIYFSWMPFIYLDK